MTPRLTTRGGKGAATRSSHNARRSSAPRRRVGALLATFISILVLALLLLAYAFLIEPYWIEVKRDTLASADLPASFDGFRIAFVSDIHSGPFMSRERLESVVALVNAQEPDLILLGGDYAHRSPANIAPCFEALAKLRASYGVYGVLGNHDHWESAEESLRRMGEAGIVSIGNAGLWIERDSARIRLGGVDDLLEGAPDLASAVAGARSGDFVILVSHNPDYLETVDAVDVDLALCGHTHGGQVTFFGLWAPLLPSAYGQKYRTGLVATGGIKVLVSNGIGTITPPARFFARPQINVITLRKTRS